ncbi:MAG: PAS domain S-box protein [Chloroflexi bacterium]|nr:PAS domain S-box protein [Chloroflexota bacterium]
MMTKGQLSRHILVALIIASAIALGWYSVFNQRKALIEENIIAYQHTELEIARSTARSIEIYIGDQVKVHGRSDSKMLGQEVFDSFIVPIHLLENGHAWLCLKDSAVLGLDDDFVHENWDQGIAEIFEENMFNEAKDYEKMLADIREAREGVGRFVWSARKGEEIAAWTPVRAQRSIWIVGVSTPLSEILESSGAIKQYTFFNTLAWANTALLLCIYFLWLFSTQQQEKTHRELRASEVRYRDLFNSAPDGVSILDKQGTILECSQSTALLYGYSSPKELVGKKLSELMSTNSLKAFRGKMPILQSLNSAEGEIRIIRPDGSFVDVWRKGHPLTDAQGNFSGILSYDRDISEPIRTENEYKKLHQAVEQSANSVVITNLDGGIEYVNPKFLRVTGYAKEEVLGENPRVLKSEEHSEEFYKKMWDTLISGNEWHGEFCNRRKDGSLYWESANITPVFDQSGKITHFIAIKEDITQQIYVERELKKAYQNLEAKVKERTAELKESEERYRLLFERNLAAVYRTSLDGQLFDSNDAFVKLMGYASQEEIQRETAEKFYFTAEDREIFLNNLREKGILSNQETLLRKKDGSPVWLLEEVILGRDEEGENYIQGTAIDITERKEVEKELKESEERYRSFFENSPISLWEEDYSAVMEYMDNLRATGIEDLSAYFDKYPEEVSKCAALAKILDVNPATLKIYEAEDKEKIISNLNNVFTKESLTLFKKQLIAFYEGIVQFEGESITKTLKGKKNNIMLNISPLVDKKVLVSIMDITERKKMEEKLHLQATTDPLTEAYNRRYFFDLAQQEIERSLRYTRPLSIMIFDIDHFKKVNDTFGHAIGDEVLRQISKEFQSMLRENDIFARYGGEEFVILLPETTKEQAGQMAERMRKKCAEAPLDLREASVSLTISFGVSCLGGERLNLDELLLRADKALYQSKEGGRNRVTVWGGEK